MTKTSLRSLLEILKGRVLTLTPGTFLHYETATESQHPKGMACSQTPVDHPLPDIIGLLQHALDIHHHAATAALVTELGQAFRGNIDKRLMRHCQNSLIDRFDSVHNDQLDTVFMAGFFWASHRIVHQHLDAVILQFSDDINHLAIADIMVKDIALENMVQIN